ncbi:hypothetical protein [Chryseobacterium sp. A321]
MKKIIITSLLAVFAIGLVSAQEKLTQDFTNKNTQERKDMIRKLSPEKRRELYRSFREDVLIEELKVQKEKQAEFKRVYSEYQESQRRIKDRFDNGYNPDALSDSEAKIKLEESFDYGQKLIENRREYSNKMQRVIRPQQVIKMFRVEGQMRDRMLNRRMEIRENASSNRSGNSNSANFQSESSSRRGEAQSRSLSNDR